MASTLLVALEEAITITRRSSDDMEVVFREIDIGVDGVSLSDWAEATCKQPKKPHKTCEPSPGQPCAWRAKHTFLDRLMWSDATVLGRPRSVYFHQGKWNWAEAHLAYSLVSAGTSADMIVNEVFHVSACSASYPRATAAAAARESLRVRGTRLVAAGISEPLMFRQMANLVKANADYDLGGGSTLGHRDNAGHHINTDLFACVNGVGVFLEAKREDELSQHQLLCLAFLAASCDSMGCHGRVRCGVVRVDPTRSAKGEPFITDMEHPISFRWSPVSQ